MRNSLTTPDIYALINRKVNDEGTAKAFAAKHGLTEAFLSAVRNGAKPIPRKDSPLTRALGVEWVPPTGGYWRFREGI
ncbi:hypothetical protein AA0481_0591 [Acetobacter orientalis NRIC 0481]|uniref:XRE family transcriptional regulator n=1 Tax=Acetobacter orientalis TaxID=146474 RepID=A0A0D6NLC1_9PROT|nr:hypothetical protein Abor_031_048 [Acetobacter orientalis]GBR14356.1 hypothetical protein AA0481_0591 [Acetobacter orientalis NRIC 0481]GEL60873.1 hypothetical protein AOR02nite_07150 [Acetobacter orientalis]